MRILLAMLSGAAFVLASTTPAAAAGTWRVLLGGADANTAHEPSGVAIDDQGNIFIVDTSGSRIEKLSPSGQVLMSFGHIGSTDDTLRRPRGIALTSNGTLLIADTANHRIQRFDTSGQPLGPWGVIGSEPGEFILPTSIAVDSQGNVYVADTGNHRVQKLSPDGQPLAQWGGLHFPHGIAIDGEDNVIVTDSNGLHTYTSAGDLVSEWTAPGEFGDPYGVSIGPDGTVFVADTDNGRIVALSPDGVAQGTWGREGNGIGQMKYPEALAIDSNGALYVADRGNDRIDILSP